MKWLKTKEIILSTIADGRTVKLLDGFRNKWQVGKYVVHVRQVARPSASGVDMEGLDKVTYGFSVLRSSLDADFELWIGGENGEVYWLMPTSDVQFMFDDPDAYADYSKEDRTIVVSAIWIPEKCQDVALYGRQGKIPGSNQRRIYI